MAEKIPECGNGKRQSQRDKRPPKPSRLNLIVAAGSLAARWPAFRGRVDSSGLTFRYTLKLPGNAAAASADTEEEDGSKKEVKVGDGRLPIGPLPVLPRRSCFDDRDAGAVKKAPRSWGIKTEAQAGNAELGGAPRCEPT